MCWVGVYEVALLFSLVVVSLFLLSGGGLVFWVGWVFRGILVFVLVGYLACSCRCFVRWVLLVFVMLGW